MFVARRKAPFMLALAGSIAGAFVLFAPGVAGAVSAFHWQAMMMDARVRGYQEGRVGYGTAVGGAFGMRHDWQALRVNRGAAPSSTARLLATRTKAAVRVPLRFRPTQRLGGLGRRLAGAERAERTVTFDRIFSPAPGAGVAPTFSGLREGAPSFSLGLGR